VEINFFDQYYLMTLDDAFSVHTFDKMFAMFIDVSNEVIILRTIE
jgi:hypothetical protein